MGYRLEMSEIKYKACGGKLYGYCDEKKLKSHQWLVQKGYLDGDEYFNYGFEGNIVLRPDEFKEFIKLYNEDMNSECDLEDQIINDESIKELIDSKSEVLLQWW